MKAAVQEILEDPVTDFDHVRGNLNAPITLVEYGSYSSLLWRRVVPLVQQLRDLLGDQMVYVFRHFPGESKIGLLAAEAAEAAGAQGKFWEMHDRLARHDGHLSEADIFNYARQLNINMKAFERDIAEHDFAPLVEEHRESGLASKVNRMPTFFVNGERYDGPWDVDSLLSQVRQRPRSAAQSLMHRFVQLEASGSMLLLACAMLALLLVNIPGVAQLYFDFWDIDLHIAFGEFTFGLHLLHWVNDGLMVIFFFVVGLEIRREIVSGELSSLKQAALPMAAALGGMVVPAAFYVSLNLGTPGIVGWGIPMATDIAFLLGVLTLLGSRVPVSLKIFFTALAIADDLGAVLVIALFYTSDISWVALSIGGVILAIGWALKRSRVYRVMPYIGLGIALWAAFLVSGVHPTIAGVLLAFVIPTRSPANYRGLIIQGMTILEGLHSRGDELIEAGSQGQAAVQTLESITDRMQSPARRMEEDLHPWTTYLILPIFALANAGVALGGDALSEMGNPITLGIILGLVVGKPLGITMFSWVAVRLKLAELPSRVSWYQLFSASFLAGIGFTMSLFISNAAFTDAASIDSAKIGVLVASLLAALAGWILLNLGSNRQKAGEQAEALPAGTGGSD